MNVAHIRSEEDDEEIWHHYIGRAPKEHLSLSSQQFGESSTFE